MPPDCEISIAIKYLLVKLYNYRITQKFCALFNPAITQELKDKIFIPAIKQKLEFIDKRLSSIVLGRKSFYPT